MKRKKERKIVGFLGAPGGGAYNPIKASVTSIIKYEKGRRRRRRKKARGWWCGRERGRRTRPFSFHPKNLTRMNGPPDKRRRVSRSYGYFLHALCPLLQASTHTLLISFFFFHISHARSTSANTKREKERRSSFQEPKEEKKRI